MTLLTIEKENFIIIKGALLSKEAHAVLVDILEKILDHVLSIEQNIDRLTKPPISNAVSSISHALSELAETDLNRMENSLPYVPKEPLTSLRALATCLLDKVQTSVKAGKGEMAQLQEEALLLIKGIDSSFPTAYFLPHEDDLLVLDKRLFAACKRICQALQAQD